MHSIAENILPLGGPDAPVPVLTIVNTSLLMLQWEEPFTYYGIQHYTISANNSQEDWNRAGYADTTLLIRAPEELAECAVYTFTVVATNKLADGLPGVVTGGFPIGMSACVGTRVLPAPWKRPCSHLLIIIVHTYSD